MVSSVLEPGSRLAKYEIVTHLATGGMGAVYKAVDQELGRTVALKVLRSDLAKNELIMERFRREARHAARLSHPNIVTLYECSWDREQDLYYLALEFIDGIDLAHYAAQRGRLQPEEVRRILVQAARAMEHAFEHGIVHRDIKPSNLMLARVGGKIALKLTDLGLAITKDDNEYRVTRDGTTVGTVDYMAPEQARDSRSVDVRSDIYSLGCTAYHLLAGRAPFAEGGIGERVLKHLQMPPPDVRQFNPAVSSALWDVLQRMLAKNPDDRYPTPTALLRDLRRAKSGAEDASPLSSSKRKTENISMEPTRLSMPAVSPDSSDASAEAPAAAAPQRKARRKKRPKPPAPVDKMPGVTPEQTRAAAAFHQRAVQVLAEGGGEDYARQLLDNCLRLDPFNTVHRKTLRDINHKAAGGTLSRWFGSLNVLAVKSKLRLARTAGDWRKVFEYGEQILAQQPGDVDAHLDMAAAAVDIGCPTFAHWLLEQGRSHAEENLALLRALAGVNELLQDWRAAGSLWNKVSKLDPEDVEARRKVNDASAQAMLATGLKR